MSEPQWQEEISNQVWRLQLIVGALVTGALMFLGIAFFLVHFGPAAEGMVGEQKYVLSHVLLAFTLGALAARAVVPPAIVSAARRKIREGRWMPNSSGSMPVATQEFLKRTGDAGKLWQVLLTRTIIAAAILEGVAFFACVTFLIEHSTISLVIAMTLIAGIALHVPTQAGVIHWLEEQIRLLGEEKQLGR